MSISNSPQHTPEAQAAYRNSLAMAILHFAATLIVLILGLNFAIPEMLTLAIVTGVLTLIGIVAAILSQKGYEYSIWLMVLSISVAIPFISTLAQGLGWVSLFSIPSVVTIIAADMLDRKQRISAISIGIASGVIALLIDLFGATTRRSFPQAEVIIPAITLGMMAPGPQHERDSVSLYDIRLRRRPAGRNDRRWRRRVDDADPDPSVRHSSGSRCRHRSSARRRHQDRRQHRSRLQRHDRWQKQ